LEDLFFWNGLMLKIASRNQRGQSSIVEGKHEIGAVCNWMLKSNQMPIINDVGERVKEGCAIFHFIF
jgi:hypothetical protein